MTFITFKSVTKSLAIYDKMRKLKGEMIRMRKKGEKKSQYHVFFV